MWPAEQGNSLSLWTQHLKSCIQPSALLLKVELWRPPGRPPAFFVMAIQSNSHKLWLEVFRLDLEEMCPMRAVQPWGSVQKSGEVSILLHFLPQPFPPISMILKAQHKSCRLCSHPHLTHCCFPLSWGSTGFLGFFPLWGMERYYKLFSSHFSRWFQDLWHRSWNHLCPVIDRSGL